MSDEENSNSQPLDDGMLVSPPMRLFAANARTVPPRPTNLAAKVDVSNDVEPIVGQPVPAPPPQPPPNSQISIDE